MTSDSRLPPGQFVSAEFPRFGLGLFARRFPSSLDEPRIELRGDVQNRITVAGAQLASLPRVEQTSDFHCVTTWSQLGVRWSGFRFADFHAQIAMQQAAPADDATLVIFHGQDGYRSILLLQDLLAADVMLADRLEGQPLGLEHGAPLRLVAPAHYGYKNVKHLAAIEYRRDRKGYRFPQPYPRFMDHPRARVAFEERGIGLPGWLLRYGYRLLIGPTVRNFGKAAAEFHARTKVQG